MLKKLFEKEILQNPERFGCTLDDTLRYKGRIVEFQGWNTHPSNNIILTPNPYFELPYCVGLRWADGHLSISTKKSQKNKSYYFDKYAHISAEILAQRSVNFKEKYFELYLNPINFLAKETYCTSIGQRFEQLLTRQCMA